MRQLARLDLESLGCPCNARVGTQERLDALQRRAKCVRRHGDQRIPRSLERLAQVAGNLQSVGESGIRQISRIPPRTAHPIELDTVPPPPPRTMPSPPP